MKKKHLFEIKGLRNQVIEIDKCENSQAAIHLRCKIWIHLDVVAIRRLIATLEHILEHHVE